MTKFMMVLLFVLSAPSGNVYSARDWLKTQELGKDAYLLMNSSPCISATITAPASYHILSWHKRKIVNFKDVDSSLLESISSEKTIDCREDFFNLNKKWQPPLIGKSDFVSQQMVEHLMRHKKDSALGVKYVVGDEITNMEGALHTFVTPLLTILMTGDYSWVGHLQGQSFGNNQVRKVILSAAIHPDFEFNTVVMPVVKIQQYPIEGEVLISEEIPSATLKMKDEFRVQYEEKLLKHMVYHLSSTHRLPAFDEITSQQIMDPIETQRYLEALIQNSYADQSLCGKFMRVGDSVISLEILHQIYVHQVRNEFKVLNVNTPQGYVYTINPPLIFAQTIQGAAVLNRLQALAFKHLVFENLFSNLKILGFSDFADPKMVPLFQKILPNTVVLSRTVLFDKNGKYAGPVGLALVLHNNSDAFGQNIETEGASSLDGVIGSYSNAASVLKRDLIDLVDFVF